MSKPSEAILLIPLQQPPDGVQTLIQVFHRRAEREPDEVVARRVEKVPTVRRVDIEEDTRDHDRLFFEELFEEGLVWTTQCGLVSRELKERGGSNMRRTRPLLRGGTRFSKFNQM